MNADGGRLAGEHLGLFDTPPNRRVSALALAIVGLLFVSCLVVFPLRNIRLGSVLAFAPTISGIIFVGELIVATLLYAQAAVIRSRALVLLASGYVFTALLLVPFALTFPGAFAQDGLFHAGLSTTAWLMIFRRWGVPISVILYALLKRTDMMGQPDVARRPPRVMVSVATAAALAAALTMLAIVGQDLLPPMFSDRSQAIYWRVAIFNVSNIALLVVAIWMLLRRDRSLLETWIVVSLATVLIQSLLNLGIHSRFSLGWYWLFLLMLFSHLVVLLALIAESNRLYVRLALSMAAQERERDARMMSLGTVAAAIAHEVGQPLTAVSLSASAALAALNREEPDRDKATRSLRDAIDASQRAFAVVRSIRDTFGAKSSSVSEFDLNDLVRETSSLLNTEMTTQKVSLRLALDDALPPILADRIQIQRVLVNLLVNAIESVSATERRVRRIAISSVAPDPDTLRLDISDSGAGIAPEAMAQIFEPFFTTKSAGTGLGLSLCRTIVESHGGRLWASGAEDGGAIFHLELHRAPGA